MDHSYEELRSAIFDILAGRWRPTYEPNQFSHLKKEVSDLLQTRERGGRIVNTNLSAHDSNLFLELFWDLFRQGIITLGDSDEPAFPHLELPHSGKSF